VRVREYARKGHLTYGHIRLTWVFVFFIT